VPLDRSCRIAAAVGYTLLLAAMHLVPMKASAGTPRVLLELSPRVQNLLHVPSFGLLALLIARARAGERDGPGRARIGFCASVAALSLAVGIGLEGLQAFVPGRWVSAMDLLLNVTGILAAMVVWYLGPAPERWRQLARRAGVRPSGPLTLALCLALAAAAPAAAQKRRDLLLVVNTRSPESVAVGEHYARARQIGEDGIVRLAVEPRDEVSRFEYGRAIEAPIAAWLARERAQDRILYIVLTKGVPLRIAGTGGRVGTAASVDSELTLLYRRLTGVPVAPGGRVENPYFLGDRPIEQAEPFSHAGHDIYLVTRLDGFTVADVAALIDRGLSARNAGRILLDQRAALDDPGNRWLAAAAARLRALGLGDRVVLDETSQVLRDVPDVLGYASWGSTDPAIRTRRLGLGFAPGALASLFVSTDGRTFTEPPAAWTVGDWKDRAAYYAGSPQSLAGDLVREGVTGLAAQVAEPFLDGAVRPDILFPAYLAGFTLAEAFYLAVPYLSWQTIVIGDPLVRIGDRPAVNGLDLDPPIDAETGLPRLFAARRLARAPAAAKREAVKRALLAESLMARGDTETGRQALEEAVALDPRLEGARLNLAMAYERAKAFDKAAAHYRAVLEQNPRSVVALNNLAYILADREKRPADALPYAQRAYTLAPGDPNVADTLGWVYLLLGNRVQAGRYLTQAVRGAPFSVDILVHVAALHVEAGDLERARAALDRAQQIDPATATREDVRALKERLESAGGRKDGVR
jgi:uncharacterized protein (TIGR03790 family)